MTLIVDPDRLPIASGSLDAAAEILVGVRLALGRNGTANTGRPSTSAPLAEIMRGADLALYGLAGRVDEQSRELVAAQLCYLDTESSLVAPAGRPR